MRKTQVCLTLACCFFTVASCAWAQGPRKPGLFEVTSTMTFQQSPMPQGMQVRRAIPGAAAWRLPGDERIDDSDWDDRVDGLHGTNGWKRHRQFNLVGERHRADQSSLHRNHADGAKIGAGRVDDAGDIHL